MSKEKIWFVTGASRGFGRTWTEAILAKGDCVVATVRDVSTMSPLVEQYGDRVLPVRLDVLERQRSVEAVKEATDRFGRIDVVINNAGYCLAGALEEIQEDDARSLFDTNVFGALWVTQAVLPVMRAQGSGHIMAVSSVSGLMGQPAIGMYNSSKWALEGMFEALSKEVAAFGIKVTIVEPSVFATEFKSAASMRRSPPNSAYDHARQLLYSSLGAEPVHDPSTSVGPILALADDDNPPLRLLLGETAIRWAVGAYGRRIASWGV